MKFHIAHIIPDARMHGLNGYREVVETTVWGLQALGFEVTTAVNDLSRDATNIVFGAQVMKPEDLKRLRADTIVYNFEQMRGLSPAEIRPELHLAAERLQIWDYSPFNLDSWARLNPRHPVKHVPVGFAPVLQRIPKAKPQDIDALIYGSPGPNRLSLFNELAHAGVSCLFVNGLYGQARDDLIARAKVVLNIGLYRRSAIFEVVRVSYLLANAKAVLAEHDPAVVVEDDILPAVRWADHGSFVQECLRLIDNNRERRQLEETGQAIIRKRDVRTYLRAALES